MNFRIAASSTRAPLAPPSTAAFWLASVSTFFAAIYWLTNQMTSVRSDVGAAVFQWERAIPFIDWTIIPYGSIVAFFVASFFLCRNRAELNCHTARLVAVVTISVICFVLWPQRFVFERPAVDGALGVMFQLLSAVGEVPQFVQHGLTVSYGLSTRLFGRKYAVYDARKESRHGHTTDSTAEEGRQLTRAEAAVVAVVYACVCVSTFQLAATS